MRPAISGLCVALVVGGLGTGAAVQAQPGAAPPPVGEVGLAAPAPVPVALHPGMRRNGAWLFVGGALATFTIGAVLAYSASSSEEDVKDLYVHVNGVTATYDASLASRYHELLDEGHRYEYLSWASFGVAAGCAVGATILFVQASHQDSDRLTVAPLLVPHETGVLARVRF